MSISVDRKENQVRSFYPVLEINGGITEREDSQKFAEELNILLTELDYAHWPALTLNFLYLDNLTPAEIGRLITFYKLATFKGLRHINVVVSQDRQLKESPYQMLRAAGLDEIFRLYADLYQALTVE